MAKGAQKRRVQVASAILVIVLLVGFTVWLASGPSNCKRAAAPILEALERYHKAHGRYPASLDDLVHEKWIPAIPETTWNLGVSHPFGFEYWAEAELDFFRLGYAEYQLPIDDDGKEISYVSFRAPGMTHPVFHTLSGTYSLSSGLVSCFKNRGRHRISDFSSRKCLSIVGMAAPTTPGTSIGRTSPRRLAMWSHVP